MRNIIFNDNIYSITEKEYKAIEKLRIVDDSKDYFEQVNKEKEFVKNIISKKKSKGFISLNYSTEED